MLSTVGDLESRKKKHPMKRWGCGDYDVVGFNGYSLLRGKSSAKGSNRKPFP